MYLFIADKASSPPRFNILNIHDALWKVNGENKNVD
jgi:hypothetical protein